MIAGDAVGPYRALGKLGEGGMGQVYRARDTRLARDVAIKTLHDVFATDPAGLARFEHEARTLAALNHPHIAQIYGIEGDGDTRALVMELVEGPTLADRLALGRLPVDECVAIARQVADALEAAHEAGVIHRDGGHARPDPGIDLHGQLVAGQLAALLRPVHGQPTRRLHGSGAGRRRTAGDRQRAVAGTAAGRQPGPAAHQRRAPATVAPLLAGTSRLEALPGILLQDEAEATLRALPGGRSIVFIGRPLSGADRSAGLYELDLESKQVTRFGRSLPVPIAGRGVQPSLAVRPDDGSVFVSVRNRGLTRVFHLTRGAANEPRFANSAACRR